MDPSADSPSPSTSFNNRDWFFPSQSFIHSSQLPRTPVRRFSSSYPRRSLTTSSSFQRQQVSPLQNSTLTDHHHHRHRHRHRQQQQNYYPNDAGLRRSRAANFRNEKSTDSNDSVAGKAGGGDDIKRRSDDATSKLTGANNAPPTGNLFAGLFVRRLTISWQTAFSIAILVTLFSSLVHKNFALHNRVIDLEHQLSMLNVRLSLCNLLDPVDVTDTTAESIDNLISKSLKNTALFFSLVVLSMPFLLFKYVDHVSNSRRSFDSIAEEVSLNKQLAYRVDLFLSVHPYAKPLALLVATLLLICLGGVALFGVTDDSLADCLWLSWTFVADSGNHANSEGIGPRLVSVSISFGGMLIFAMMLGLVSDAISEKFDSLRKGRSEVVEQYHTLILGWSDKLGSLLNQLAIANESLGGGIVVVMAERDKEEMELDIAKMEFDFRGTSVICRSGSPLILADLKKVSVSKARAIIVLAEDGNADQSDARALRTVLSLTGVKEGLRGHIVVELSDLDNEVLVKLVGGDLVETVVAHDVIGRLMIQCARQPGLAQIWEDILGFENCEFYIKRWPQLDGMSFEDVLISFPDAIPCGVKVASGGGKIILNPDDSYVLQEGDEVLVIAEDDDTYAPTALPMVKDATFLHIARPARKPQKILLSGWRRDIDDMIVVSSINRAPNSSFSSPECCRFQEEICPKTLLSQNLQSGYFFVVGDEIWKI